MIERANFFPGQDVVSDDLNFEASTRIAREQVILVGFSGADGVYGLRGGVAGSPGSTSLAVSQAAANQVNVAPGVGFTDTGKYVEVPSNPLTSSPVKPTRLGLTWSAPTGTVFVKVAHVAASGTMKADDYGASHATRYYDTYEFVIDANAPSGEQILLATFTNNGSNQITGGTLQDARIWMRAQSHEDNVLLSNSPVGSHTKLSHHISSVGTGTPSDTNPHGQSVYDLDDVDEISAQTHHQRAHIAGILLYNTKSTNDWKGIINQGASFDSISFSAPQSGSVLLIDGIPITSAPTDLTPSGTLEQSQYYNVLISNSGTASFAATSSVIPASQFLVGTVYYDSTNGTLHKVAGGARTEINDARSFFVNSQEIIRADFDEVEVVPSEIAGLSTFESDGSPANLITNLNRLRGVLTSVHGGANWRTPPNATLADLITRFNNHTHSPSEGGTLQQGGPTLWTSRTSSRNLSDAPRPATSGGGTIWFEKLLSAGDSGPFVVDNSIDWRDRIITAHGFVLLGEDDTLPGMGNKRWIKTFPSGLTTFFGVFYSDLGTLESAPSFAQTPGIYVALQSSDNGFYLFVANQLFPSNVGNLMGIPLTAYPTSETLQGTHPTLSSPACNLLRIEYSPLQNHYNVIAGREASSSESINES